jgi:hypothetical protein
MTETTPDAPLVIQPPAMVVSAFAARVNAPIVCRKMTCHD